jgi:hypothetical protein
MERIEFDAARVRMRRIEHHSLGRAFSVQSVHSVESVFTFLLMPALAAVAVVIGRARFEHQQLKHGWSGWSCTDSIRASLVGFVPSSLQATPSWPNRLISETSGPPVPYWA